MENYDDQMFDFLSTKDNLSALIIANEQFGKVRTKLISNFWEKVKDNLELALTEQKDWKVVLEKEIFSKKSKLYVYDENAPFYDSNQYPILMFVWEELGNNPFAGMWLNMEMEGFRMQEIMDYIIDKKKIINGGYEDTDGWWPFWIRDKQVDFNTNESLIEISKENMEKKAKSFSEIIYQMMDKLVFSDENIYNELQAFYSK